MIITLVVSILAAFGVFEGVVLEESKWYKTRISRDTRELLSSLGLGATIIGFGVTIICITWILLAHAGTTAEIEKNRIEYESLIARKELIHSEYEDISRSDVVKDIAEWNKKVTNAKYWGHNPWTNWFFDRDVVISLQFIE